MRQYGNVKVCSRGKLSTHMTRRIEFEALVSVLPNEKSREIAQLQVKASHRQAKEFRDLAEKVKEK